MKSLRWRLFWVGLLPAAGVVAGVAGVAAVAGRHGEQTAPWAALLYSSAIVAVAVVGLDRIAAGSYGGRQQKTERQSYGWLNVVLGADGRLSTSKAQMFAWTVGIAWALLYLSGIVIFAPGHDSTIFGRTQWDDYLVLLGGPFAAGVLAKFAVVGQLQDGTVQKTLTSAASTAASSPTGPAAGGTTAPQGSDLVSNDDGELDLVDTQYVIFNLVALAYVFGTFISRIVDPHVADAAKYSLPVVPSVILALTSASAATYVANKAVQKSGPRISAINPTTPKSGETLDIFGVNLVPAGADPNSVAAMTTVLMADTATGGASFVLAPADATTPSTTKVTVAVPSGLHGKIASIRIVTSGGVATDAFLTPTVG